MPNAAIILSSLEAVAERCEDPTPMIYARLFEMHPDMEALFVMDTDGGVRGSMVASSLDYIMDYIGPRKTSLFLIPAARMAHDGYGVPDDTFDEFFVAMRDTFAGLLGADWTDEVAAEWAKLLTGIGEVR